MENHTTYYLNDHLTEHFTIREMLHSNTAQRLQMLNPVDDPAVIENLRRLCQEVLEPLRLATCAPVMVISGYRSECLNYVVGGAKNSQHCRGEAADLFCGDEDGARLYYDFIRLHLPFDQLILEHRKKTGAWWVHVSYTVRHALRKDAHLSEL